ncbi:DUF87 domain-containing protein [Planococcus halotolerans]|nr:DUF87 domain-containing protein [Planococcus halotolerans]
MFENTSQIIHFYNGNRYSGVMIGSYVGIKRGQYVIVGKVEKEYAIDSLNDINNQEFSKARFVREVEVKVIGSFKNEKYISGMVAFPQIFNDVILLSNTQTNGVIDGGDTEPTGTYPTLALGNLWPEGIKYYIKWYKLFNTHVAIFGNTGSGKSNTLAKLYYELFLLEKGNYIEFGESQFVFIDFNGEYSRDKIITDNKKVYRLSTEKSEDRERDYLKIPESKFWDKEMLSVLFGATEQTQQPFLNRVLSYYFEEGTDFESKLPSYLAQAFSNVYIMPSKNGVDLFKQTLELLKLNNDDVSEWINLTQYNNVSSSFYSEKPIIGWKESKNKYYWNSEQEILERENNRVFRALIDKRIEPINNPMRALQIASYLKMIYELRQSTIQYDHIAPLLHRIESRVNDFSKVFEINSGQSKIFEEKSINVVSLKNVNQDMKMLIPMIIAKVTYETNKKINANNDRIFNLIIDEAHNILSESSSRESEKWKDYRLEVFEEIIKEGRKFGYYLTLSSQRPADISSTIVSQIHNYFIHRLVNDNDLKLLDRTMSSLDSVSKDSIPNLAPGQVILTGVSFELPVIVQIDQLDKTNAPDSANIPLLDIWKAKKK